MMSLRSRISLKESVQAGQNMTCEWLMFIWQENKKKKLELWKNSLRLSFGLQLPQVKFVFKGFFFNFVASLVGSHYLTNK